MASLALTSAVVVVLVATQAVVSIVSLPLKIDEALAFVIIGVLSHSLGILGHETYHKSFFRSDGANNLAGAWLFHYPLLGRFEFLREQHFLHHRFFGTEKDPDRDHWGWSAGDRRHLKAILKIGTGWSFTVNVLELAFRRGEAQNEKGETSRRVATRDLAGIMICQIVIFTCFAFLLEWYRYVFLWILPIVTIGALVEHLRVFCEHNGAKLRVFSRPSFLGLFFFGRANFRLHAIHHQSPSVPWFALGAKYSSVLARGTSQVVESADYLTQLRKVWK